MDDSTPSSPLISAQNSLGITEDTALPSPPQQIVFVTGLSGAGMSSVLNNLEDFGFEVFDNLPLFLIDLLLNDHPNTEDEILQLRKASMIKSGAQSPPPSPNTAPPSPIAFGLDSRTRGFSPPDILKTIERLKQNHDMDISLCFVNCAEDVIQRRYSLTRRPHPLAREQTILEGINIEKDWLKPLREAADLSLDTTDMSVHDLKKVLESRYGAVRTGNKVYVTIMSFGFKNGGLPREADSVFDVRFLKNPHWEKSLRPMTGREQGVQDYIAKDEAFLPFLNSLHNLLEILLPRYEVEGKSYFTLAIGCTGGKHRSVFIAEKLHEHIAQLGFAASIRHRDLQ